MTLTVQLVTQTCYSNECLNNYITTITSTNIHSEFNTRLPTLHKLQSALLARDVGWRPLHDYPAWPPHCVHLVFTIELTRTIHYSCLHQAWRCLNMSSRRLDGFCYQELYSNCNFTFVICQFYFWLGANASGLAFIPSTTYKHFFSKERLIFNNNTI